MNKVISNFNIPKISFCSSPYNGSPYNDRSHQVGSQGNSLERVPQNDEVSFNASDNGEQDRKLIENILGKETADRYIAEGTNALNSGNKQKVGELAKVLSRENIPANAVTTPIVEQIAKVQDFKPIVKDPNKLDALIDQFETVAKNLESEKH